MTELYVGDGVHADCVDEVDAATSESFGPCLDAGRRRSRRVPEVCTALPVLGDSASGRGWMLMDHPRPPRGLAGWRMLGVRPPQAPEGDGLGPVENR